MSDKLNKGLDEIVSAQRRTAGRRRSQRRSAGRAAVAAPAGGIQKKANTPRGAGAKGSPTKGAAPAGESKVIVSNLPKDVSEQQIKEYFVQSVGPIKRVELSYGPNSQSRGIANVIFHKPDGASKAFQKLNGLLVDNRPIKIEIVVGAAYADKVMPQVKTLAERAAQPKGQGKSQPKSAAAGKQNNSKKAEAGKGAAANKKRRARSARPAKKTAEELDTDMNDYWKTQPAANGAAPAGDAAPAAAATAAAAPAANGDAPMDEIM